MPEAWRSNPNYYCEYCGVWMADNIQTRSIHERGMKHKENMARKLSDMRKKAVQEKRDQEQTAKALVAIEAAAQKQYEADRRSEEEHRKAQTGTWEYHVDSGYYYNALHRWYYDLKSTMYYGGDPPEWTANPPLPADARYAGAAQPRAAPGGAAPASKAAVSGPASRQHGAAVASAAVAARTVVPGSKVSQAHPLAGVGGYQMPSVGKIGGAKGLGAQDSGKRKRDEGPGGGTKKPVSKEEAEALARREAARQRVQARTMASFGLQ